VAVRDAGIKRRLRTLVVGGDEYLPIYGGEAVHSADGVVGRVRSCAYGFTARKNLAYSYLPVEVGLGAPVQVELFGNLVPASVTSDAVISRQKAAR
jgi:4-methylaminobutanoate oxidase (formaldehyde-forming)